MQLIRTILSSLLHFCTKSWITLQITRTIECMIYKRTGLQVNDFPHLWYDIDLISVKKIIQHWMQQHVTRSAIFTRRRRTEDWAAERRGLSSKAIIVRYDICIEELNWLSEFSAFVVVLRGARGFNFTYLGDHRVVYAIQVIR